MKSKDIMIRTNNDEVVITGNKTDLIELANYITKLANSNQEKDHIHLDNLTIIDENSNIKNLIIEKTN